MPVIYYQNSLDGRCAAAIARYKLRGGYTLPTNFGYQPDFSKLRFGDKLFLLGVLWDNNAMNECVRNYKFVYIDHHASSKKDYKYAKMHPKTCIQDLTVSTCISTWRWFFPDDPVPEALQMISDYTLGKFDDPATVEFMEGLNTIRTYPDADIWETLFKPDNSNTLEIIRSRGRELIEFSGHLNETLGKQCIYETTLLGYKCLAVNYRTFDHRFFQFYLDDMKDRGESIDMLLMYAFRGFDGQYKVTVYRRNPKINLTELLPRLHGGGQEDVGAFSCDELPFEERAISKPYKPTKFDIKAYTDTHLIARQYKQMGDRSLFNQCVYYQVIGGLNCGILNTPEESKQAFDHISPTLPTLDLGICWAWDNRGQYKISVFPLSGKLNQEGVIKFIVGLGFEGGAKTNYEGITFFVDILPFERIKRNESILLTSK